MEAGALRGGGANPISTFDPKPAPCPVVAVETVELRGNDGSAIQSLLTEMANVPDPVAMATGQPRSGGESSVGGAIVRFVRLFADGANRLWCCPAVAGGAFDDADAFLGE